MVLLGAGGLYRYHTNNDHLACINGAKGGNGSDLLQTLYLVPKDLESKVCLFSLNSMITTCSIPTLTD